MGISSLWGGSSAPATEEERRAQAIRSGAAVPSRAERKKCWDSRDLYFGCLDRINVYDALDPAGAAAAQKSCAKESQQMDRDCAAEWVVHFKKYRLANHQKEQRLAALKAQGAFEVQINNGPGDSVPANKK
ncbi:uncharacterized protein SPSK_04610 [Sporothrix schenckii 1099-18]|uniref:Cytochrome c oxidase assembly factor 6 n=2 Tax=Sporothrix schenckii TaxID=29908 RepID=U7PVF5_SPOS1|nr:uncharacterized protein SPSK_04610 [Sporothrix schenckii 1099-18]ERS98886.1 hypothetical protein HMPREF1624_04078 [Sporothrix schenckii ATCC 58251]KJR83498.1 hypothetical protein SPSK_04610 [Sporothrix schenckii 1099-18]